jgi:hypothetical protein
MLDEESLRPVIISMALYIVISIVVPHIAKKPTGIQIIDDLVMTIIAQRDSLMSGTILTGLITFATNYIQDEFM